LSAMNAVRHISLREFTFCVAWNWPFPAVYGCMP
jgi:hypothetical protein